MHINDFDYNLPEELIAQFPADKRDHSRLMVVDRSTGSVEHRHFYDILEYLKAGDCLVLNNSRVIPARIFGIKAATGARVEFLLIKRKDGDRWETMVRPGKKIKKGDVILFGTDGITQLAAYFVSTHLRFQVVSSNLGRFYQDTGFTLIGLLHAAVEEEGNVSIFLSLCNTCLL